MKMKYNVYSGLNSGFPLPKSAVKDTTGIISETPVSSADYPIYMLAMLIFMIFIVTTWFYK